MNAPPLRKEDLTRVYEVPTLTELGNLAQLTAYTVSVHV